VCLSLFAALCRYAIAQAGDAVAISHIERTDTARLSKNLRDQLEQKGRRRLLLLH
jgi:hypothetical protein